MVNTDTQPTTTPATVHGLARHGRLPPRGQAKSQRPMCGTAMTEGHPAGISPLNPIAMGTALKGPDPIRGDYGNNAGKKEGRGK